MQVPLKYKGIVRSNAYGGNSLEVWWIKSHPFYLGNQSILVHRLREAYSFMIGGEYSHDVIHFLCGNGGSGHGRLLDEPPAGRLVCERCEKVAKRIGLPSADTLCGRHVHVGRLRAIQACCTEQQELN